MDEELIRTIILSIFTENDIKLILRIYRWAKSERNSYFYTEIVKRIDNYKKGLKRLRNKFYLIYEVKHHVWRANEDLYRIGKLLLELRYYKII